MTTDAPNPSHPAPMPVALEELRVTNFQSVQNAVVGPLPTSAPWVFLVGGNGVGKTSLMRAIAVGLNGPRDGQTMLVDETTGISVRYRSQDRSVAQDVHADDFVPLRKFAAYGPSRVLVQGQDWASVERRTAPTYGIFNDDGIMLSIESWLRDFYVRSPTAYYVLVSKLLQFVPGLVDIAVQRDTYAHSSIVVYSEHSSEPGEDVQPLVFSQLPSTTRALLSLIGDVWMRLSRQHRGELNPALLTGIVLIDDFDDRMGMGPTQERLSSVLSRAFPRVQFIASCHGCVIPEFGAPEGSVFLEVSRTQRTGTAVVPLVSGQSDISSAARA